MTTTKYFIRETYDGDKYHTLAQLNSPQEFDAWVEAHPSREPRELKIYAQTIEERCSDIINVPAHIPTLEEIADDIISGSDGSFYIEWGDDFSALTLDEQARVEEIVHEDIGQCGCCGWNFSRDSLSEHINYDEPLCWRCYEDADNEEDEEEDEG